MRYQGRAVCHRVDLGHCGRLLGSGVGHDRDFVPQFAGEFSRLVKKNSNFNSSRSANASFPPDRPSPFGVRTIASSDSSAIARTSSTCTALLRYTCCHEVPVVADSPHCG